MNYPGHLGVGVLTFGVVAHNIDLKSKVSIIEISILLLITMISASKIIDQDLKFAIFLPKDLRHKRYLYHRQVTHSLVIWLIILMFGLYGFNTNLQEIIQMNFNINYYILFFAIGGLSHLLADMLTGSIPIFLWGKYRRGFRIGINIEFTKKFFVSFGDKMSIPMMFIGVFLIYYDGDINNILNETLNYLKTLI